MSAEAIEYDMAEASRKLGVSRQWLFTKLRKTGALGRDNLPNAHMRRAGYFRVETGTYDHPHLGQRLYSKAKVTEAGLIWLATRVVGNHNGGPNPAAA